MSGRPSVVSAVRSAALAVLLATGTVVALGPLRASAVETCVRAVDAGGHGTSALATAALRQALLDAAAPGAAGCTSWRVDVTGTFALASPLEWDRAIPLQIVGPAGATARFKAVPASVGAAVEQRILTAIGPPGAVGQVTLERLVLTGGDVSNAATGSDPFANRGGAVLAEDLRLIDVELTGNRADIGGAVAVLHLDATRTSLVGNRATSGDGLGGAVHAEGEVTLENVTFRANQASFGGAVWMDASGDLAATFVTFLANIADAGSGAPGADLHRGAPTGPSAGAVSLRGVLFGGLGTGSTGGSCGGEPLPAPGAGLTAIGNFATEASCGAAVTVVAAPTFGTVPFLPGISALPVIASGPQTLGEVACGAGWPREDQRGLARPQGASCDAGAVERAAAPVVVPQPPPEPVEPSVEVVGGPVPTSVPAGDGACADGCVGRDGRGPARLSRR